MTKRKRGARVMVGSIADGFVVLRIDDAGDGAQIVIEPAEALALAKGLVDAAETATGKSKSGVNAPAPATVQ